MNTTAAHEMVLNTKTGTKGEVVCRYNRTNDGKAIVQVETVHGKIAQLSKGSEAFAKYRVLAGSVYRNDFANREAALAFAATL